MALLKRETNTSGITPECPTPIVENLEVVLYKKRMGPRYAVDALLEGYYVMVTDFFSSGLEVLQLLKQSISESASGESFIEQREARSSYREMSHRLLLKIKDHKLVVRKAPVVGWFKSLYPDLNEFLLPFPVVQGMNSSWQWFEKGVFIPVLKKKIHPWYGVYFPTRFEHLELFDHWLKNYRGEKNTAMDIGVGSGVLTMMLLKYGFKSVSGSDINPNTIIGMNRYSQENDLQSKLKFEHGDLFTGLDFLSELVVFNPAWLPESYESGGLDRAVYYDQQMFPRFFEQAVQHLAEDGRLVILFSNLAGIVDPDFSHPVEAELATNSRFTKELFVQKQVRKASAKTKRNLDRRAQEKVELWVLKLRSQ